jgi:hypothetical protein
MTAFNWGMTAGNSRNVGWESAGGEGAVVDRFGKDRNGAGERFAG